MDYLCTECNSLSCACDISVDGNSNDYSIVTQFGDDSFHIMHRNTDNVSMLNENGQTENYLTNSMQNNYSQSSMVNLNLCKKGINIGFLNVQGLRSRNMSKFSEIELMLTSEENKNLHIFSMCETKLKDTNMNDAFTINGFHSPYRKDNHTNGGGGIIVYVRKEIMSKRRLDLETNDIACLWLEVTPNKGKSFLVGSLYRNPTERVEWIDRFEEFLENILIAGKEIILLGDFNKDLLNANINTEWSNFTTTLGLSQLITQPTRVTNSSSTLIDHIYTNYEHNLSKAHVAKIGISDHYAIFCNRKINSYCRNHTHKSIQYRSFKTFDENAFLNDLLSVQWQILENFEDIDDIIRIWYSLFIDIVDKHAPVKEHRIKSKLQPDWLTPEILDSMKERDTLKSQGKFDEYKILRNKVSSLIQESKQATYKNKIEEGKDDPKSIWKFFKEFGAASKNKDENNMLGIRIDDRLVLDETELAECFNDFFINIASKIKEPIVDSDFSKLKNHIESKIPENVLFELPEIDETFVFKFLSSLDISKATGLDGIGPRLLKLSSPVITKSITFVVRQSLLTGKFPSLWKQAKVNPLHKGGAKEEINNYRPISILPTLSKLLEKFIQKHLMTFMNTYDVLHQSQSGFRSGYSTETALTLMTERWLEAINEGKIVGTVAVDFRKAFDLVDHSLLLKKLTHYRCGDNFIALMKSYLNNRVQVVNINGKKSNTGIITCGVPQGSILGPLLFLIFINDLPLYLSDTVSSTDLYADDTTIYDMQADLKTLKANLQKALIILHEWCKQNGMLLNTEKTKVMLVTTRQRRLRIDESLFSLTYNDIDLQITTGEKILGVNIDENMQWNNHFQAVCKKVSSYIWLLSKISPYINSEHKLLFYNAYIHPHFNYCNIIWGNSSNYNVSRMNKFQRRACKIILKNEYLDLENARKRLNILSFDQAVFLNKAKTMYKVFNNIIPQYICNLFQLRSESLLNTSLRSISNQHFTIPKPKTTLYKESLSYSGPVIWNSIPLEIKNSLSMSSFTKRMLTWMSDSQNT